MYPSEKRRKKAARKRKRQRAMERLLPNPFEFSDSLYYTACIDLDDKYCRHCMLEFLQIYHERERHHGKTESQTIKDMKAWLDEDSMDFEAI